MPDHFQVDIDALAAAAVGVGDAIAAAADQRVEDLDVDGSAFGHEGLAATTKDFGDRWQRGVDNLLKDGEELATRLQDSATTYFNTEQVNADSFTGMGGG